MLHISCIWVYVTYVIDTIVVTNWRKDDVNMTQALIRNAIYFCYEQ
jgi:hypothetical protein